MSERRLDVLHGVQNSKWTQFGRNPDVLDNVSRHVLDACGTTSGRRRNVKLSRTMTQINDVWTSRQLSRNRPGSAQTAHQKYSLII